MFSSNQKFKITGDKINSLKSALNCILSFHGSKIIGYSFSEDGMILHWASNRNEFNKIPEEDIGNIDYLFLLIQQYLISGQYKKLLKETKDKNEGADGSSCEGWEIGAYQQELKKYDDWSKCIYIKPFWTFYHK